MWSMFFMTLPFMSLPVGGIVDNPVTLHQWPSLQAQNLNANINSSSDDGPRKAFLHGGWHWLLERGGKHFWIARGRQKLNRLMPQIAKVVNLPQSSPKSTADLWLCVFTKSIMSQVSSTINRLNLALASNSELTPWPPWPPWPPCHSPSLGVTHFIPEPWTWNCNTRRSCCVHSRKFPRGISQGSPPSSAHKQSENNPKQLCKGIKKSSQVVAEKSLDGAGWVTDVLN
jgi:hypothetical protein